VAVISLAASRLLFGTEDAIGRTFQLIRILLGGEREAPLAVSVVGVVSDCLSGHHRAGQ